MNMMLLAVKKWFNQLNEWANRKDKRFWPEILFLIGLFVLILLPLATVFSLIAFYFPWFFVVAIPVCFGGSLFLVLLGYRAKKTRQKIWNAAKYLLILPICFCGGAFLFGAICWLGSDLGIRMISSKIRFPLSTPLAIAVDSKGRVYCLSRFYNRMQVFNSDGQFIRGWFVGIPKGAYHILIDDEDNLRVATERWGKNLFFDTDGNLLNKSRKQDFFEEFDKIGPIKTKDVFGNIYRIENKWIFPKVVKIDTTGKAKTLICNPFNLWFVTTPFPAFAFLMGSVLFLFVLSKLE